MSRCKHFLYTYLYWTSTIYTFQKSIDWPWKRVQNPFHIFLRLAFGTLQGPYLPSHVHIYDLCCVWAFLWPWLEQQAESSVADQEFKELFLSRGTWKNFVFNCIFSRAMRFPILKRVLMVSLTVHLWFHFLKNPTGCPNRFDFEKLKVCKMWHFLLRPNYALLLQFSRGFRRGISPNVLSSRVWSA